MKWRIIILIGFFSVFSLLLISNLYNLQFNKRSLYEVLAENQQLASGVIIPNRGAIYFTDKNNNQIAAVLNKDYYLIYADSREVQQTAGLQGTTISDYAQKISKILDVDGSELEKKFSKKNDTYEVILFKATKEQVDAVKSLDIKGLYTKKQLGRFYPFDGLASHLLGFVSVLDGSEDQKNPGIEKGRYGVEAFFDRDLAGSGGEVNGDKIIYPQDGSNIYLTVDINIQTQAEEILKKLVDKWEASGGSVIVQEPKTGRILSMASFPNFNPNKFFEYKMENFINPVAQLVYEPGSVFKPVTMAAGIDSGKITPDTSYIDTGSVTIDKRTIKNWDNKAHGRLTMTNVIEKSINTGTVFAEKTMGHDIFSGYVLKFGFGGTSNISLPGELKGSLVNLKNGKDVNYATASFGQGISVTPIQMINAFSAIANGGVLMKPLIIAAENPEVIRRVISKDTASKVTQMMVSAVKENILADIPNYSVAGKTGTAFVPDFKRGGYTDEVINTYIGFVPAPNPQFVILIKLEKPKNAPLAGQTVLPAFRELAEFILTYYNVAPDKI